MRVKLGGLVVLSLVAMAGFAAGGAQGQSSDQSSGGINNQGVGMYADASTAMQMSTFTINPRMVSCGVGTLGGILGSTGPFSMLMYSTKVDSYKVDTATNTITATGTMRSITHMGGQVVEDAMHPFTAIAVNRAGVDRYDLHFTTPFWNAGNPTCSRSSVEGGGCRFGGDLLMGEIAA